MTICCAVYVETDSFAAILFYSPQTCNERGFELQFSAFNALFSMNINIFIVSYYVWVPLAQRL